MNKKLMGFSFAIVLLVLLELQYNYIAGVLFYIYSFLHVYPERQKIFVILKNSLMINFYKVVILFISYILSLKYLSLHMRVDEQYLKFSPTILALLISFFIVVILIFVVSMLYDLFKIVAVQFLMLIPGAIEKFDNTTFSKWGRLFGHFMVVLMLPFFLLAYSADYVERVALLTDASFISDCGVMSNQKMYLRKNKNECYVFALNSHFLTEHPSVIISPSN